jgi:hypothetical protein
MAGDGAAPRKNRGRSENPENEQHEDDQHYDADCEADCSVCHGHHLLDVSSLRWCVRRCIWLPSRAPDLAEQELHSGLRLLRVFIWASVQPMRLAVLRDTLWPMTRPRGLTVRRPFQVIR